MGQKLSSNSKTSSDVKLLLFGSHTSGKLSFIKQTQLIYQGGRSGDEAQKIRSMMRFSLCILAKEIVRFTHSHENQEIGISSSAKKSWNKLNQINVDSEFDIKLTKSVHKYLMQLWSDMDFQNAFLPFSKFKKEETIYLIENSKRIIADDFIPTDQDISKFRMKSTGTSDTRLEVEDCNLTFIDVGGQKCDRKKWIHHFDDIGAILFFVSFDEYDQPAENPKYENKMKESLSLFEEIINNKFFTNTTVILMITNKNLFKEKLKIEPLSTHFPDYNQSQCESSFLLSKFKKVDKYPNNRRLFIHTFEIDESNQIKEIFQYVTKMLATISVK